MQTFLLSHAPRRALLLSALAFAALHPFTAAAADEAAGRSTAVISAPETQAKLGDMGFKVAGGTPPDMARALSAERLRYAKTIQTTGIMLR